MLIHLFAPLNSCPNNLTPVGLFGPNGAGKTTCFSIIAGLISSDKGFLSLNQTNITNIPMYIRARLGITYLPQDSSIFRELSVFDNVRAILEIYINDKKIIDFETEKILKEFNIFHLAYQKAFALSGGERRRLEIARTIAIKPKFCMLDEPFAGVDHVAIDDLKQMILNLKAQHIGILITDHNIEDTLDIVDRAYIIYDGKILIEGSKEKILQSPEVRKVYLGSRSKSTDFISTI